MKPCRKQNIPARRSAPPAQPAPPAVQTPETPIHRYVHPIRTARPAQRSSAEEMLSYNSGDPLPAVGAARGADAPDGT